MKMVTRDMRFDPMPLKRAFIIWGRGYQALADIAGCSIRTAHSVVNGSVPCSRFLRRIAGVLGVNPGDCWKVAEGSDERQAVHV